MIRILIMAMDENRGIGLDTSASGLPWYIPEEMSYFQKITQGNGIKGRYALVMGRKTYTKILSFREKQNIIDLNLVPPLKMTGRDVYLLSGGEYPNHLTVKTITAVKGYDALFVCGGKEVYEKALNDEIIDFVLISKIKGIYRADTHIGEFENKMIKLAEYKREKFTVEAYKTKKNISSEFFKKLLDTLS